MIKNAVLMLVTIVLATSLGYATEPFGSVVPTAVETAVLAEDWARVAALIGDVKSDAPAPIRLILGHACLALNRNNDSLVLFLGAAAPSDLDAWQAYGSDFKKRNSQPPIADYFVGDGLARLEKYDDAIAAFDAGLKVNPNNPLLLNAQGVCFARAGRMKDARTSFVAALNSSGGTLLDVHVNRGMWWIQGSDGAEGAMTEFTAVTNIDGSSALALHGKAMLNLLKEKLPEAYALDEAACAAVPVAGELFAINENLYTRARISLTSVASANPQGVRDAGHTLQTTYDNTINAHLENISRINDGTFMRPARENIRGAFAVHAIQAGSDDDFKGYIDRNPERAAEALNALVGNRGFAQRGVKGIAAVQEFLGWQDLAISGAALKFPVIKKPVAVAAFGTKVLSRGADAVGKHNERNLALLAPKIKIAEAGVDASERLAITRGKYKGSGVPDPTRSSQRWPTAPTIHTPPNPPGGGPGGPGGSGALKNPGGADLDMKVLRWDEGNWPFIPIYGLAYGLSSGSQEPPRVTEAKPDIPDTPSHDK